MSIPEEIESQSRVEREVSVERNSKTVRAVDAPMEVAVAIDQLRGLVCGLGIGLLVVSLALTAFVYKQNRDLVAATELHKTQMLQLQATERSVGYVVEALARYSVGKPELMAVLTRHGLQVMPSGPSSAPSAQRQQPGPQH
jgi:hypothetical protein